MGKTYRYLATVEEGHAVLDWFRALPERLEESVHDRGCLFYFGEIGGLESGPRKTPMVNVILPRRERGLLTTLGEVHFLPTPQAAIPELKRVKKRFRSWLEANPCVYSHRPGFVNEWDYFLEGSIRNWDSDVFALPAGKEALEQGAYFVSQDDNDNQLDLVFRKLQLRGVEIWDE